MYNRFHRINGSHPWRVAAPDGFVDYKARRRTGGKVLYFNFALAREMGLIPVEHPDALNPTLEKIILDTFCLEILNEWDAENRPELFDKVEVAGPFMATRYLQQQHRDKRGKTSGDGRSIWNGCLRHKGKTWDLSSRGTGATCLSPGAQEARKVIQTGDETQGYASGRADTDEMLGGAVMSEIFHRRGIPTERCLAVIDFPDGSAVGVRAAQNLIRPAHLFRYLKLGRREELRRAMEYFIERQESNGEWELPRENPARLSAALDLLAERYAALGAQLAEEYIFSWFSWDGDNLLMDGSLLDYGSIRQFAAFHDQYRYEDVDRLSASLPEQRRWLRRILQTFAQGVEFIISGEKKPLAQFADSGCLRRFDKAFDAHAGRLWIWRLGFTDGQGQQITKKDGAALREIRTLLGRLEKAKVSGGLEKVPDGVTHFPAYIVRNLLREFPVQLERNWDGGDSVPGLPPEDLDGILRASYAGDDDLALTDYRKKQLRRFEQLYLRLIRAASDAPQEALRVVKSRSQVINFDCRMTGDGLVWIVKDALAARKKLDRVRWQGVVDLVIESQVLLPGQWMPLERRRSPLRSPQDRFVNTVLRRLESYKETL